MLLVLHCPTVRTLSYLAAACFGMLAAGPSLASEKLKLCYESKLAAPWRTGNNQGLNFDMLREVQARLGLQFEFEALPWKRCLAKLGNNEVDGAFSASFSPERRAFGVYPDGVPTDKSKYMHYARYVLVRKKGSPVGWDGTAFSNLDGPVGFQLGYSIGATLQSMKISIDESSDSVHNFGRKLLVGRLAAAAMFDSDATLLMHGPLAARLEVAPIALVEKPYFLMLSHSLLASRPELAHKIWRSIEEVRRAPAYDALARKHGVVRD